MTHAYLTFRRRLALHALARLAASLKSSAEIVLLVFAHVLIGVFALVALPPLYAASLAAPQAIALLTAHGCLMALPMVLLRHLVLPADVVHWSHRLPLAPATRLRADALVAALLVWPLALLYLASVALWLWQAPSWLLPLRGVLGTLYSLLLTYACSIAVLSRRARLRQRGVRRQDAPAPASAASRTYTPRHWTPRLLYVWHRLFWLPFWRNGSMVGWQQSMLLVAALGAALPWMQAPPGIARGVLALLANALMVLLTDRGDKAVRQFISLLGPYLLHQPLVGHRVALLARALVPLPALLVLAVVFGGGLPHRLWDHAAGRVYLALACAAQLLIAGLPAGSPRARVALVVFSILVLTSVGSEL